MMATNDAELLAKLLRTLNGSIDAKLDKLQLQRDTDSRLAAENHGENKQTLNLLTSSIVVLQRQMSSLIGEGQIDGRIGTMQRDVRDMQVKLDTMQWKFIGLLGAFMVNFVTMIVGYLATRK